MESSITIDMTDEQTEELKDLIDHAIETFDTDAPGMIIGQLVIFRSGQAEGEFAFVDHETGKRIQEAVGTQVGLTY